MEIAALRNFLKLAELGNFTRAAAAVGLSQPALSQQIARLEEELGVPVIERQGRPLRLTEAGTLLRERAARIVALADDTVRELGDDGIHGQVIVAAIPTIAPYLLPGLLRDFAGDHPEARVQVNEEVTESLLRRCAQGELDVGVLALPIDDVPPYLQIEPLFDDPMRLVLPAGHPLADRPAVALDAIRDQPLVLLDAAHCLSAQIQGFCRQRSFQPVTTGRTTQLTMVQELVALGHGVSFIPGLAERLDASDRRVYRPLEGESPTRTIAACWNPYRYQSRLARAFLERLRTYRPAAAGEPSGR